MIIDRNKPVLRTLSTGTPNAHEISVSSHPQVLGQVHYIQHLTPGTLGNAIRRSSDTSETQFSKFSKRVLHSQCHTCYFPGTIATSYHQSIKNLTKLDLSKHSFLVKHFNIILLSELPPCLHTYISYL